MGPQLGHAGIGRALTQQCAVRGAHLALSDINAEGLAATVSSLPAGTSDTTYIVDISKRESEFAHDADVQRDFGTPHFVINNARVLMTGTFDHNLKHHGTLPAHSPDRLCGH